MRSYFLTALLVAAVLLGACSKEQNVIAADPVISVPFDPTAADFINGLGTATVSGRTYHGQTHTGEFASLQLIPVTAYSVEYMRLLFGGNKAYYTPVRVANVDDGFKRYQRRARADGKGMFKFSGVPPGDYFVYSQLVENRAGVALHERITVGKGQKLQVDVSGS